MRSRFLRLSLCLALLPLGLVAGTPRAWGDTDEPPNILFLLTDQWRFQSFGFTGNPDVQTPRIDALAAESLSFENAVAGYPVCSPTRASLLTGKRPLSHGVFLNDVPLPDGEITLAEVLRDHGYATGYIGKWHLDGRGRSNFTPPERRQGFQYWKALECSHRYNNSSYYADTPEKRRWDGYDAFAQTDDAIGYLSKRADSGEPFLLYLSWGPPHAPYHTAPERYQALYDPEALTLRPNVPARLEERVRQDLAGYYAHCTAIDDCVGRLLEALDELDLAENTIVVFTSEHGDLLGSHGAYKKQQPYEESVRIPFLLRWPGERGTEGRVSKAPMNSWDVMPTLLGLCDFEIPEAVEGIDFSAHVRGGPDPSDGAAFIHCPAPFGQWSRQRGGKEYRGLRTDRYTYVRDLDGPWLLFDNKTDPYQLENLVDRPEHAELQAELDAWLDRRLEANGDTFEPAEVYIERWGYKVDETGTVPYEP